MRTRRGTPVILVYNRDCEPNKGGWWIEVYKGNDTTAIMTHDRIDDFCIHPGDCDCEDFTQVERLARKYIQNVTEY